MHKTNLPPATIMYTGEKIEETVIKTYFYNSTELLVDKKVVDDSKYTEYITVNGFSDTKKIHKLLVDKDIDSMIIEDVFNIRQRSKIEVQGNTIFVVLKTIDYIDGESVLEYISLILVGNTVIAINETHSDIFKGILERLEKSTGIIRSMSSIYLLYALIDIIVDMDMQAVAEIENKLSIIEDLALDDNLEKKNEVYVYRKELNYVKNSIAAFYDSTSKSLLLSHPLVTPEMNKYFHDVFDHVYKLSEQVNNGKETLRIIYEIQMNNISLNMNKIMQTLTIFSAIFIPLSFLAGVFGMNFNNMPLLQNESGFIVFSSLCAVIIVGMLIFFKNKKFF